MSPYDTVNTGQSQLSEILPKPVITGCGTQLRSKAPHRPAFCVGGGQYEIQRPALVGDLGKRLWAGREGERGYSRSPGVVPGCSSKVFTIEYAARSM